MKPAMNPFSRKFATQWTRISPRFLPFADAATTELPLSRLLRLSLFQVSVGMVTALLIGTLNRVMIVEMGVSAWLVSLMVGLPLLFAPFRALVGFKSDTHRSVLGWKRVPYIWMGTLLQFGGLAIMPFALIILSGDTWGPAWVGHASAALAFLLVGAGVQTTQTAGLALATDLAPAESRPRVVALMYVMLLVGMVVSGFIFGQLLESFTPLRLIKVVQGAATITAALNLIALWKQEPRNPAATAANLSQPDFTTTWRTFIEQKGARRFLIALGVGTAAFNMQDIILEPYGGEILGLGVGATTTLTAMMALGALVAFAIAARWLQKGGDPYRVAGIGIFLGTLAFAAVIFAYPLDSATLFRFGSTMIGFGGGLFSVGTLTAAMSLETEGRTGLALGAWGAVQACTAGAAIAMGGGIRDGVSALATQGTFGEVLIGPATGYGVVYLIEIILLFVALETIGPLVRNRARTKKPISSKFGLAEFPS